MNLFYKKLNFFCTKDRLQHGLLLVINSNIKVGEMVLMVQKEVADRFAAKCGTNEYGYFTVYINYYYRFIYLYFIIIDYFTYNNWRNKRKFIHLPSNQ